MTDDEECFTLADLERLSGVPMARLRYIVDSKILPPMHGGPFASRCPSGRGVPRSYGPLGSFVLLLAAMMLEACIKRRVVKACLKILCSRRQTSVKGAATWPIEEIFGRQVISAVEIGDGVNLRWLSRAKSPISSGWLQISTGSLLKGYEPLVTVRFHVRILRDRLNNSEENLAGSIDMRTTAH